MSGMGMMMAMGMGSPGSGGATWPPTEASLSIDFTSGAVTGAASLTAALACSRASTGYAEDAAGNWTSFANNVLRRTDKGLLTEEARTNALRNSAATGAVIGTPGTIPTFWSAGLAPGLSREVVGFGTYKGVDYVDLRIFGTYSGGARGLALNLTLDVLYETASPGQAWSFSAFLDVVAGSLPDPQVVMVLAEVNSVPTATYRTSAIDPVGWGRRSMTYTLSVPDTIKVASNIWFYINPGVVTDFTIRVGWPQTELGAFPTSPIRTTAAVATRAADNVSVISPATFLSFTQGSIYSEHLETLGSTVATDRRFIGMNGDAGNYIVLYHPAAKINYLVQGSSATQANIVSALGMLPTQTYKMAGRWADNSFALRCSSNLGAQPANDVSGTAPVGPVTYVSVGGSGATFSINSYTRRIAFFLTALTDAQLMAMVS